MGGSAGKMRCSRQSSSKSQRPLATADSRIPTADNHLPAGNLLLEKVLKRPCDPHSINELKIKNLKNPKVNILFIKVIFDSILFFII